MDKGFSGGIFKFDAPEVVFKGDRCTRAILAGRGVDYIDTDDRVHLIGANPVETYDIVYDDLYE